MINNNIKIQDSIKIVINYLNNGFYASDLDIHILNCKDYFIKEPNNPCWKPFAISFNKYFNNIKLHVIDLVRSFSTLSDKYECRYNFKPTATNTDLNMIIRYINLYYKDEYSCNIDNKLLYYFVPNYNENSAYSYLNIINYFINNMELYEFTNGFITCEKIKNFKLYIEMMECKRKAREFIYSFFMNHFLFSDNNSSFKNRDKYGNDEKITKDFEELYNIYQFNLLKNNYISDNWNSIIGIYGEYLLDERLTNMYNYENVIWVSRYAGNGFGYDFIVNDGSCHAIEVKSTISYNNFLENKFFLTENEINTAINKVGKAIDNYDIKYLYINNNKIIDSKDFIYTDKGLCRVKR